MLTYVLVCTIWKKLIWVFLIKDSTSSKGQASFKDHLACYVIGASMATVEMGSNYKLSTHWCKSRYCKVGLGGICSGAVMNTLLSSASPTQICRVSTVAWLADWSLAHILGRSASVARQRAGLLTRRQIWGLFSSLLNVTSFSSKFLWKISDYYFLRSSYYLTLPSSFSVHPNPLSQLFQ